MLDAGIFCLAFLFFKAWLPYRAFHTSMLSFINKAGVFSMNKFSQA
jgi:hypothetical protein